MQAQKPETMKGTQILKQIRENARDMTTPNKHGTLLSIDMDEYYIPKIHPEFIDRYSNFLNLTRDFFDVVHVWHNIGWKQKTRLGRNSGKTEICEDDKKYKGYFNDPVRPKVGERVLGKKAFSAFSGTDLSEQIPHDSPVYVMGTLGQQIDYPKMRWCIDETIREGLHLGFNMVAIPDMINERYARRHYKGVGRAPIISSSSMIKALGLQKSLSNDNSSFEHAKLKIEPEGHDVSL